MIRKGQAYLRQRVMAPGQDAEGNAAELEYAVCLSCGLVIGATFQDDHDDFHHMLTDILIRLAEKERRRWWQRKKK